MSSYGFKNMDKYFRSYFLGYFLADGWLQKVGNSVRVCFESKDKELLNNINVFGVSVRERQRLVRTGTVCTVYGMGVSRDVGRYVLDVSKGKKYFIDYWKTLSSEEKDSFILGFFDGDGSVCYFSGGYTVRIVFYVVQKSVYRILLSYLNSLEIKYSVSVDRRGKTVVQVSIGCQRCVRKLYDRWYRHGYYLKRKYDIMHRSLSLQGMVSLHSNM